MPQIQEAIVPRTVRKVVKEMRARIRRLERVDDQQIGIVKLMVYYGGPNESNTFTDWEGEKIVFPKVVAMVSSWKVTEELAKIQLTNPSAIIASHLTMSVRPDSTWGGCIPLFWDEPFKVFVQEGYELPESWNWNLVYGG